MIVKDLVENIEKLTKDIENIELRLKDILDNSKTAWNKENKINNSSSNTLENNDDNENSVIDNLRSDSATIYGVKAGYYFYDPNIYKINNRISLDLNKIDSNADFYITSLKLDWIKNTSTFFAPFVGINIGYLYFESNGYDYSTNIWGGEAGILFEFEKFNIELEGVYQKAFEKKQLWKDPLKTIKIGIEINL